MDQDPKCLFLMKQRMEEEKEVGRHCEGQGMQSSVPEILENELILVILQDGI